VQDRRRHTLFPDLTDLLRVTSALELRGCSAMRLTLDPLRGSVAQDARGCGRMLAYKTILRVRGLGRAWLRLRVETTTALVP
jgi:hypothetical protein